MRVLGLKKWTFVRIFFALRETDSFTALETLPAFFVGASFFAGASPFLGAMS